MATKQRFPWVAVSAVVSTVVVVSVAWLQLPEDNQVPAKGSSLPVLGLTKIGAASPEELLAERVAAYDPTPMFIPSAMTSSEPKPTADSLPGAAGPFAALPSELTKAGPLKFPPVVPVPVAPVDGLRLTARPSVPLVMARADEAAIGQGLAPRLAQVEVVAAGGGREAVKLDLPAVTNLPTGDWQPLELIGAVTREGLVGELVVTTSSGVDEIDAYFRFHLRKKVRIGVRLPEGFYTFRVGP